MITLDRGGGAAPSTIAAATAPGPAKTQFARWSNPSARLAARLRLEAWSQRDPESCMAAFGGSRRCRCCSGTTESGSRGDALLGWEHGSFRVLSPESGQAGNHPPAVMSSGPVRSRKRKGGFASVLKISCPSGSAPIADLHVWRVFGLMIVSRILTAPDQLRRMAIARRSDGLYCLFEQARWPEEPHWSWCSEIVVDDDSDFPEWRRHSGLFASVAQAETEARSLPGFADAVATGA